MLLDHDDSCYGVHELRVFNLLKHPVWVFDIDRRCMYWANHSALEVWNADSLDALLQRDFASDMSESAKTRLQDLLARFHRNEVVTEQWTFYPSGRGATTLMVSCSGIRLEKNRMAMLVEAEVLDKTEIPERTIRDIEMLRHLPFAVSQYSIDGKLIYQNPEAVKQFGNATTTTPTEQQDGDFMHRFVDRDMGSKALLQVQEGFDFDAEAECRTQQNGSRWFSVGLRRTRDPVTSGYVILFSARDISDIVKAREETTKAAMKSEFMAVMAHEIRTPLHQVIGYMDLLEMSRPNDEQKEYLVQVQMSTSLLMSIINDLLDYSKLGCGQVQMESVVFSLDGLLRSSLDAVRPEANRKNLALVSSMEDNVNTSLVGDPNRLRQILLNLLSNAVKFTSKGSVKLSVSCVETSTCMQRVRFEVTDTGIGIAPRDQEAVFQEYRQANTSIARNFGGTGLGLAICKGLVNVMGGTIGVESEVGVGTTMFFEVPFELSHRATDKSSGEPETHRLTHDITALNILVCEDNKVNQKVIRSMLERLGHTVTIAENGQLALEHLSSTSFDLIFMDVQMPVMDGIECTKQIRTTLDLHIPVIGLTASYQNADHDFYQQVGMNSCLGKPLRFEQLRKSIASNLRRPLHSIS